MEVKSKSTACDVAGVAIKDFERVHVAIDHCLQAFGSDVERFDKRLAWLKIARTRTRKAIRRMKELGGLP